MGMDTLDAIAKAMQLGDELERERRMTEANTPDGDLHSRLLAWPIHMKGQRLLGLPGRLEDDLRCAAEQLPLLAAELEREREKVAELVEALKGVIQVANRNTVEFDAARAALAKAGTASE